MLFLKLRFPSGMERLLLYSAAVETGKQYVTSHAAAVNIMTLLHSRRESLYLFFQLLIPKPFRLHIAKALHLVFFVFRITALEEIHL